ncbi:MAG: 4'-phosphopantetheinyl transferase family protein [Nocardioidaceae bacterium]
MTDSGPATGAQWMARGEREIPRADDWLTPHEAAAAKGMRFTKRRREYLLRRWVCKQAVAAAGGLPVDLVSLARIEVRNHPTGAPFVHAPGAPSGLEVALTDRAGWAVCMVGTALGRLGCDLELVEPRSEGFVVDFLTPFERDWVASLPAADWDAAANHVWSAKESALKELHTGQRRETRIFDVRIGTTGTGSLGDGLPDGWSSLDVRLAEGGVLPGWWRRDGRFLLTVASERPLRPPTAMGGSRALDEAQPTHSWVDRPFAD